MRNVARFTVVGLLILSCFDVTGPSEPQGCPTPLDTLGLLTGGPLHLGVGGADNRSALWQLEDCHDILFLEPATVVSWILRDTAVARLETPHQFGDPAFTRTIVAKRPGSTFMVIQLPGRVDSLSVQVKDTTAVGAIASLWAAFSTSCAVDGASALFCWGAPLGPQPPADAATCFGALCNPVPVQVATDVRSVHIGLSRWCRILTSGPLVCSDTVAVPTSVSFAAVTLGSSHACGLDAVGKAYCWGKAIPNVFGNAEGAPDVAGDHRWVSLATHGDRTCGVTDSGALHCWGLLADREVSVPGAATCTRTYANKSGGTVTENYPCSAAPFRVTLEFPTGTDSTFADVIDRCARTVSGHVFCHDPATGRYRAQPGVGPFQAISVGAQHACGLDGAGSAWCWGENFDGQLGDGTGVRSSTPVRVAGSHTFVRLASGGSHTCGLTAATDVWCWGGNFVGQTGTPILNNPRSPVRVRGQP